MLITIIWDNPTRSHIDRAEFGKKLSFKRKLGFKPATIQRSLQISMPEKINMGWKRSLAAKVNEQFQMDRKATIYTGEAGSESRFVMSARGPKTFSNMIANGILRMRALANGKLSLDNIINEGYKPHAKIM